jgi:hypothetical protein
MTNKNHVISKLHAGWHKARAVEKTFAPCKHITFMAQKFSPRPYADPLLLVRNDTFDNLFPPSQVLSPTKSMIDQSKYWHVI